jgi:hypothetical protein
MTLQQRIQNSQFMQMVGIQAPLVPVQDQSWDGNVNAAISGKQQLRHAAREVLAVRFAMAEFLSQVKPI